MRLYAIKHLPTGYFLPERRASDPGYTHLEPVDPEVRPPRLFPTPLSAMQALNCWLRGKSESYYGSHGQELLSYVPVYDRRSENMGVVTLEPVAPGDNQGVVDLGDLTKVLEYAAEQDNGWDSLSTPDWFVSLAKALP